MLPDITIIPWSTLSVLGLSFLISLITMLLNRKFIDKKKFAKWRQEINEWNKDRKNAKKTGDKKLASKVKRQEAHVLQIQSRMFKQQMKTTLITFVPLLIMWQILPAYYGTASVAFIPVLPFLGIFPLPFFYWYLICSFFTSTMLSKLFGMDFGMGSGLQPGSTSAK